MHGKSITFSRNSNAINAPNKLQHMEWPQSLEVRAKHQQDANMNIESKTQWMQHHASLFSRLCQHTGPKTLQSDNTLKKNMYFKKPLEEWEECAVCMCVCVQMCWTLLPERKWRWTEWDKEEATDIFTRCHEERKTNITHRMFLSCSVFIASWC